MLAVLRCMYNGKPYRQRETTTVGVQTVATLVTSCKRRKNKRKQPKPQGEDKTVRPRREISIQIQKQGTNAQFSIALHGVWHAWVVRAQQTRRRMVLCGESSVMWQVCVHPCAAPVPQPPHPHSILGSLQAQQPASQHSESLWRTRLRLPNE